MIIKLEFVGKVMNIRKAKKKDANRIAEIEIFNYRLNFYPIFKNDEFYFDELQVSKLINEINKSIESYYVYDDGVIKGFMQIDNIQLKKLFVEPVLQNNGIGSELLKFANVNFNVNYLWALEKNIKAIKFYLSNGFRATDEKIFEEGTSEYLVKLVK